MDHLAGRMLAVVRKFYIGMVEILFYDVRQSPIYPSQSEKEQKDAQCPPLEKQLGMRLCND